jgi:predicted DCC family thiol-disulfide oxidoreductase YuxK
VQQTPPAFPTPATHVAEVEVFYDGECPLCMREIRMLRGLDKRQRILFTNIADATFDAARLGLDHTTLMNKIHGRLPDGSLIEGVEVFRRLYSAVGFKTLVACTRLPGVTQALDFAYEKFAKHRLRLTGRCNDAACSIPKPG